MNSENRPELESVENLTNLLKRKCKVRDLVLEAHSQKMINMMAEFNSQRSKSKTTSN